MKANITLLKQVGFYAAILIMGFAVGTYLQFMPLGAAAKTHTNTASHFQNVSEQVIIYSTQWCPHCKHAKVISS